MTARTFLLGLVLGALLAGLPLWLWSDGSSDPAPRGNDGPSHESGDRQGSSSVPSTSNEASRADLLAEIERLRARLEARREVETPETADGPVEAVGPLGPAEFVEAVYGKPSAHGEELFAEFERMFHSGAFRDLYGDDPDSLFSFLIDTWVSSGHPGEALALLQRFDVQTEYSGYAQHIGSQLLEQGDRSRARDAFLMSLRGGNHDWDLIGQLMELDPAEALRQLQQVDGEVEGIAAQRALLLLATGETEAGLAAFDALVEAGDVPNSAWEQLVQRSPTEAEARLLARLEADGQTMDSDQKAWLQMQVAQSQQNQGRGGDARDTVLALLGEQPENGWAINRLAELDRDRALSWLQDRARTSPTDTILGNLGAQLQAAGRTQEALDAYWRAIDMAGGQSNWNYRVLQLDPIGSADRLGQVAERTHDDELFGDIADALWQSGNKTRAYQLWRRALELDPTDGEWINKVNAVDEGREPM